MRLITTNIVDIYYPDDITYLFNRDKVRIIGRNSNKILNVIAYIAEVTPNEILMNPPFSTSAWYSGVGDTIEMELNQLCIAAFKRNTLNSSTLIKRFLLSFTIDYIELGGSATKSAIETVYFSGIWGTLPPKTSLKRNYRTNVYVYNNRRLGAPKILKSNPDGSKGEYHLSNILELFIPKATEIKVTPVLLNFYKEADTKNITVLSDGTYDISTSVNYLTVSQYNGEYGLHNLAISVTENPSTVSPRGGRVTFKSGGVILYELLIAQLPNSRPTKLKMSIDSNTIDESNPTLEIPFATDLYDVIVVYNYPTDEDVAKGALLRWIDSRGENQTYLFKKKEIITNVENNKQLTYGNMFDIIYNNYDESINTGRSISKIKTQSVECYESFIDKSTYDYLSEVITSPVVDMHNFNNNVWESVNITASALQVKSNLSTLNFIVNITPYQLQQI